MPDDSLTQHTIVLNDTDYGLVLSGLHLALAELHNQIATCPDVNEYAEAIEEIEVHYNLTLDLKTRLENNILVLRTEANKDTHKEYINRGDCHDTHRF